MGTASWTSTPTERIHATRALLAEDRLQLEEIEAALAQANREFDAASEAYDEIGEWNVVLAPVTRMRNRGMTDDAMLDVARETLLSRDYVAAGDHIVVTAGVPFDMPGTTNLLKVEAV